MLSSEGSFQQFNMLQNLSGRFLEQLAKQFNAASHCSPREQGPAGTERALDNCAPQEAAGLPEEQMFSILTCISLHEPGPKSLQRRLLRTACGICTIKTLTSESNLKAGQRKHQFSFLLLSSPSKLGEACHYKPAFKRLGKKISNTK